MRSVSRFRSSRDGFAERGWGGGRFAVACFCWGYLSGEIACVCDASRCDAADCLRRRPQCERRQQRGPQRFPGRPVHGRRRVDCDLHRPDRQHRPQRRHQPRHHRDADRRLHRDRDLRRLVRSALPGDARADHDAAQPGPGQVADAHLRGRRAGGQPWRHRQPGAGQQQPPTPTLPTTRPRVTAVAIDGRNGAYKAYAANGRVYDLTIDFDALSYTMTVNGAPVQKTFAAGAGEFVVAGTQRLRTAADLVIGNHDFGSGLVPYIAARRFGTTLVDGAYNLATRNVAADGSATTHPGTARISGNVLSICQTDVAVQSTQNCPGGPDELHAERRRRRLHRRRHQQRRGHHLPAGPVRRHDRPAQRPDRARRHPAAPGRPAGVVRARLGHAVRADEHRRLGDDGARRRQHLVRRARRRTPTTRPACSGSRTPVRSR